MNQLKSCDIMRENRQVLKFEHKYRTFTLKLYILQDNVKIITIFWWHTLLIYIMWYISGTCYKNMASVINFQLNSNILQMYATVVLSSHNLELQCQVIKFPVFSVKLISYSYVILHSSILAPPVCLLQLKTMFI